MTGLEELLRRAHGVRRELSVHEEGRVRAVLREEGDRPLPVREVAVVEAEHQDAALAERTRQAVLDPDPVRVAGDFREDRVLDEDVVLVPAAVVAHGDALDGLADAVDEGELAAFAAGELDRQERPEDAVLEADAGHLRVAAARAAADTAHAVGDEAVPVHDVLDVAVAPRVDPGGGEVDAGQGRLVDAGVIDAHVADRPGADAVADAVAAAPDVAVGDGDVLAEVRRRMVPARGADGEAVVAGVQGAVRDLHVARAVDGEAVGVGDGDVRVDPDAADVHAVAAADVARPGWGVVERDAGEADAAAAEDGDHRAGAEPLAVDRLQLEPVLVERPAAVLLGLAEERGAVAVDGALAGDGDVVGAARPDEVAAAPLLAVAPEVLGEGVVRVVVRAVHAALERRALGQVQLDAALELDRPGRPRPRRNLDAPAAGRARVVDRALDGGAVRRSVRAESRNDRTTGGRESQPHRSQ